MRVACDLRHLAPQLGLRLFGCRAIRSRRRLLRRRSIVAASCHLASSARYFSCVASKIDSLCQSVSSASKPMVVIMRRAKAAARADSRFKNRTSLAYQQEGAASSAPCRHRRPLRGVAVPRFPCFWKKHPAGGGAGTLAGRAVKITRLAVRSRAQPTNDMTQKITMKNLLFALAALGLAAPVSAQTAADSASPPTPTAAAPAPGPGSGRGLLGQAYTSLGYSYDDLAHSSVSLQGLRFEYNQPVTPGFDLKLGYTGARTSEFAGARDQQQSFDASAIAFIPETNWGRPYVDAGAAGSGRKTPASTPTRSSITWPRCSAGAGLPDGPAAASARNACLRSARCIGGCGIGCARTRASRSPWSSRRPSSMRWLSI